MLCFKTMYVLSKSNETFDAEMQNFDVKQQLPRCNVKKIDANNQISTGAIPSGKIYISVHKITLFFILGYTYLLRNN